MRCSRWRRAPDTAWCGSWWDTASAPSSTKNRRCRITASPGAGPRLLEGMTIAIEPMITMGNPATRTLTDKWTVVTADGSLSAHFEHTVAIRKNGARILTK